MSLEIGSINQASAERPCYETKQNPSQVLPKEMMLTIFSYLNSMGLKSCCLVSKEWKQLASKETLWKAIIYREIAFGAAKWAEYIGDVGDEPPLPSNIHEILKGPCPFTKDKTVGQTHLLTLIPKTVNGKTFNLNILEEYVKNPKKGTATKCSNYWEDIKQEYGDIPVKESHWVALTIDVIEGSRKKTSDDQKQLLEDYSKKANASYEMPRLLETVTSLFMKFLQSGIRLYDDYTYTRCQERVSRYSDRPLIVGGFVPGGLLVFTHDDGGFENHGIGGMRKFS